MYCRRKGEALRLSTGMLKKPWISFWWRSMVIRWVRPAQTRSGWRWWHLQSRQLQQCVKTCAVEGNTLVLLTSFTHHRGDELWDDGASLPHLTLLAVGEVREDACDASGTGCPARVHHDQHLHYGGVHVSDTAERWREKRGGWQSFIWVRCFRGKACWNDQLRASSFLLGHCLDHKHIFASHRLLDLHPRFYGNKQDMIAGGAARKCAHINTHLCTHSYLTTKPAGPVSFIRAMWALCFLSHKPPPPAVRKCRH